MYYSNVQGNVFHVLRKYGHALVEWGFEIPHSESEWCVYAALFDVLYSTVQQTRRHKGERRSESPAEGHVM